MYEITVDKSKKLFKMAISGYIKEDEMNKIFEEMKIQAKQFKVKEANLLGDFRELKPMAPEVNIVAQKIQAFWMEHFDKKASMHASAITNAQTSRLGKQAVGEYDVIHFTSEEEAMKYLGY